MCSVEYFFSVFFCYVVAWTLIDNWSIFTWQFKEATLVFVFYRWVVTSITLWPLNGKVIFFLFERWLTSLASLYEHLKKNVLFCFLFLFLHDHRTKAVCSFCLNIYGWLASCYDRLTPQWGTAGAEIKVPSGENTELKRSPFKAWSRSVYSRTCYA